MFKFTWKKAAIALTSLLVIWLGLSLFLTSQATSMVFNPSVSWAPVPKYDYELSFIQNKAGHRISLWYFENTATDKVILYLHGNAGRLPNLISELKAQASVLSPAYPGYHESESSPSVEATYEAAELAYDHLVNSMGVSEDKIIILGHSMGGSPAVYLASKKQNASKLILINTFSSIQSMCFKSYTILCAFGGSIFNSAENAKNVKIPVRQFAYRADTTVPYAEGEKLYTYFDSTDDKKFISMDKTTHSYPDWELIKAELT